MANRPPHITTESGTPTTIEVVQSTRRMNFLTVHENELDAISAYNSQSTAFYSLASAAASSCLTLIAGALFADKLSDTAKAISWIGIPTFAILSVAFIYMASSAQRTKESSIVRIKTEAQDNQTPAA